MLKFQMKLFYKLQLKKSQNNIVSANAIGLWLNFDGSKSQAKMSLVYVLFVPTLCTVRVYASKRDVTYFFKSINEN